VLFRSKKNDVVVGYQGKEIPDSSTFRNEVAITPVGSEARVTLLREGKKEEVMVKIANIDEASKFLAANVKERLGAEVRPLTPQESEKYGLKADAGVVIRWLEFKGPLQKAGFEINDIILGINDQPVTGLDIFVQLVSSLKPHQKIGVVALDHRTGNQGLIQVETK
jgi:serine protease Do